MQIVTIETGGVQRILDEQAADIIVLRGEALAEFQRGVSAALGRPFDLKGTDVIHGVRRPIPGDHMYRDAVRDWFFGEPMPESRDDMREQLIAARERVVYLEGILQDLRRAVQPLLSWG
jgi:hypothetical protein